MEDLAPRKADGKEFYVDKIGWPFIWTEFSKKGYITGYNEDMWYSTFDYLEKGFYNTVRVAIYLSG